ncbi:hypothetical protein DOTSEDRAFT_36907 [Dothistroma septosporum NZE10]|uniref:Acyltransferase 3 domain-containing protein n=1 Tax=Dothistroma septosporum (strain NZE10 / CBS 128990) TaxID=675120 RepID=N1PJK9_DOTSN|nr:hypothetical protein DOTSEDRAFT_36907 [Dothistroma septosporum NZE10]
MSPPTSSPRPERAIPTSTTYLTGLRGFLSLAVVNSHLTPMIILGYDRLSLPATSPRNYAGARQSRSVLSIPLVASCIKRWSRFTVPGLKLLYSGSPAVAMFFCISGYLASRSYVRYVQRREVGSVGLTKEDREGDGVAHEASLPECNPREIKQKQRSSHDHSWLSKWTPSLFHRPVRLLLLSALSMVPTFICTKLGLISPLVPQAHGIVSLERAYRFGLDNFALFPTQLPSWLAQSLDLLQNSLKLVYVMSSSSDADIIISYNPVLWTVRHDLRAWLVLVAMQGALLGVKKSWRLFLIGTTGIVSMGSGSMPIPLFLGGWAIAELHHAEDRKCEMMIREPKRQDYGGHRRYALGGSQRSAISFFLLGTGLYFMSYPTWQPQRAPQFALIRSLNIAPRSWHSLGALLTLYSLRDVSSIRRLFEMRIAQFLGRYSFSIYLTHVIILATLGPAAFERVWKMTGYRSTPAFVAGFGIAYIAVMAGVLGTAATWRAFVEEPSRKAVAWLYKMASIEP